MSEERKPRQAATVILLREAEPKGFEAFLTRRPDDMPFLGGLYCYPGGSVSKDDFSERIVRRCSGLAPEQARKIVGAVFSPRHALGFWIAAIRELFEEAGVLLAANACGERSLNQAQLARLPGKHKALLEDSLSFADLLESEGLLCDLSRLGYFSHWQTPAKTPQRFDTRFFVATLPPEQTPLPTSYEVAHSLWLTPDRAIQLHERGELPMIFPTFASLRTLADFETLESVSRQFGIERPFSSKQR